MIGGDMGDIVSRSYSEFGRSEHDRIFKEDKEPEENVEINPEAHPQTK